LNLKNSKRHSSHYRNVSTAHGSRKICGALFGNQWSELSPSYGNAVVGLEKESWETANVVRVCDIVVHRLLSSQNNV